MCVDKNGCVFSIIIPCYNAAGFIDRAIQSVLNQTIDTSMYEIIAVNDASTDDTLVCLNKWKRINPDCIKIISYSENLRQGGARNVAIRMAEGEYICFLDADDWMEGDALETFMVGVRKDMDIITALSEENYEYTDVNKGIKHTNRANITEIFEKASNEYISYNLGYVWSSVYRKKIITENEVWFPEHLAYEDIYWQRLIKFYMDKACVLDKVTHHHYNHAESTMNKKNASHHIDRLTSYERLLEVCTSRNLIKGYYPALLKDTIETYYFNSYYMFFSMMDTIPDVYNRIRVTIYKYFPDWETEYNDENIPMVFQYMLKLLKKANNVRPEDLVPFKDAMIESVMD